MVITIRQRNRTNRRAGTLAKVGMVSLWLDDPVIPAQLLEADVERLPAALGGRAGAVRRPAAAPLAGVLRVQDQEGAVLLVEGERGSPQLEQ